MRLIYNFGKKFVINEDTEVAAKLDSCYRRTCNKCKELSSILPTVGGTDRHVDNLRPPAKCLRIVDHPTMCVRKTTPKFPSRERHLAVRRTQRTRRMGHDDSDSSDDIEYGDAGITTVDDTFATKEHLCGVDKKCPNLAECAMSTMDVVIDNNK